MDNLEFKKQLEARTKQFSVVLIKFLKSLKFNAIDSVILKQVLRSGTSIGANYREANRAESRKDFIHKIGIVEKEASETQYWMSLIEETWVLDAQQQQNFLWLQTESNELLALFITISRKTKLTK